MKKPAHPSKFVRATLGKFNLGVSMAAKHLGVSRLALSKVINGKAPISWEMAVRLSKAFGGKPDAWLKMQFEYNLTQIDRLRHSIKLKRYRSVHMDT